MADNARTAEERHKFNKQIGARCKQARVASGLTQEKLAERLNVSTQYVSDMERGVVGMSLLTLNELSDQLSVTTDFLLKESSAESSNKVQVGARTLFLNDREFELLKNIINTTIQAFHINDKDGNSSKKSI